jgi:hypothetical protein
MGKEQTVFSEAELAAGAAFVEQLAKGAFFPSQGDKGSGPDDAKPAPTVEPTKNGISWVSVKKAMAKAVAGGMLDDDEKAAVKAYMEQDPKPKDVESSGAHTNAHKPSDEAERSAKDEHADKIATKSVADAMADLRKSLAARDAQYAKSFESIAKSIEAIGAMLLAQRERQEDFAKALPVGPRSAMDGQSTAGAPKTGGASIHVGRHGATGEFGSEALSKSVVADKLLDLVKAGDPVVRPIDLERFVLRNQLRPEVRERLTRAS